MERYFDAFKTSRFVFLTSKSSPEIMARKGKKDGKEEVEIKSPKEVEPQSSDDSSVLVQLINRFNAAYTPSRSQEEVIGELVYSSSISNLLSLTTKTLPSKDDQQSAPLFQVVLMIGHRRLHRIAYTSSSLALSRKAVFQKAFAWLANLSYLVTTFKAHYQAAKTSTEVMQPLCLPGLLLLETSQSVPLQGHPFWCSTLKLLGLRSDLKSRGSFRTIREAEESVFEQAVAYLKSALCERILESPFGPVPYISTESKSNPVSSKEEDELPPMPTHLDSWLDE